MILIRRWTIKIIEKPGNKYVIIFFKWKRLFLTCGIELINSCFFFVSDLWPKYIITNPAITIKGPIKPTNIVDVVIVDAI